MRALGVRSRVLSQNCPARSRTARPAGCNLQNIANQHIHSLFHRSYATFDKDQECRASTGQSEPSETLTKGLKETAALDELLDKLMASKSQQVFYQTVAENILSFDQNFWMRLAARSDTATSEDEKQRLSSLASTVMNLVEAILQKTEDQLSESAKILQDIMRAAADEKGEWQMPLSANKLDAMKQAMEERSEYLDEALLSNAFAWMHKATDDGLDGMVALIQKVLQLYAARSLARGEVQNHDDALLMDIITVDDSRWDSVIRELAEHGELSEVAFTAALQRKMESTVLSLQSGSYAQRIQAEYLKELEERGKGVFKSIAGVD